MSKHETGTVTKQTTGAVSKHETGTVTKQTTGARGVKQPVLEGANNRCSRRVCVATCFISQLLYSNRGTENFHRACGLLYSCVQVKMYNVFIRIGPRLSQGNSRVVDRR